MRLLLRGLARDQGQAPGARQGPGHRVPGGAVRLVTVCVPKCVPSVFTRHIDMWRAVPVAVETVGVRDGIQ